MSADIVVITLPHPPGTRYPVSRQDFGDRATIGLNLRRIGVNPFGAYHDNDYGLFAGQDDCGKWIVAIKNLPGTAITRLLEFDTLEELKLYYELD